MRTKTTTAEDYDVELVCKTCGYSHKGGRLITHDNGSQSFDVGVPTFCKWCEMIAERKEEDKNI